uniref:Uncharacterized protein n=1 Tax=Branchiostoma floridae TaxID=7739 RepID=C3YKH3_BRAFL|eukprot:XP_002603206.1 hypothetical protein BRAFLDRAFT_93392 [Branchiostoma floridae]
METSESAEAVKGNTVGPRKPPIDSQSIRARKARSVPMGRLPRPSSSASDKTTSETQQVHGRARLARATDRHVGNGSQMGTPSGLGYNVDEAGRDVTAPGLPQEKAIVSRSSLGSRYLRRTGVSDAMAQLGDPTAGSLTWNRSISQPPSYDQKQTDGVAFVKRHSEGMMATASSSLTPSISGPLVPYRSGGDSSQSTEQDSFLSKFRQKYAHLLSRPKPLITTKEGITSRTQRLPLSTSTIPEPFKPIQDPGSRVLPVPREDLGQGYVGKGSRRDSCDVEVEEYSNIAAPETEEDIPTEKPPPGGYVNALYLETQTTSKSSQDRITSTLFVTVHLTSPTSPGDPTLRVAESLFQANIKDEQRRQLLRKALAKFQGVLTTVSGDRIGLHFFTVQHLDNFWSKVILPGAGSVSERLDPVLITDQMRVAVLGRKLAVKVNIDEEEYLYVRKQLRKSTTENICSLSKLWMMHVRNNAIHRLPAELHRLSNLQVIDVAGNPLEFPPAEVCGKGLSAIMGFVRDHALPEIGKMAGTNGQLMSLAVVIFFTVAVIKETEGSPPQLVNVGAYDVSRESGLKPLDRLLGAGGYEGVSGYETSDVEDLPIMMERRRTCKGYFCCMATCAQHMFSMHPVIKNGRCYCSP